MSSYKKLLDGYVKFKLKYQGRENAIWRNWAKSEQNPKIMIIACSDSRVNPVIITQAGLGDLFIVNNVANLVPPYKQSGNTHHSTSAAIEYAITQLQVEHIIIMGHSGCGGIRALMTEHDDKDPHPDDHYSFIRPWMKIVDEAADFTEEEKATMTVDALATVCERRASLISLNNLVRFPWVQDAILANKLKVHAWHFDIGSGTLLDYNPKNGQFETLI